MYTPGAKASKINTPPNITPESTASAEYSELYSINTPERAEIQRSEIAHDFADEMDLLGFKATVIEGENNPLPDIVKSLTLVEHDALPDEPTIWLYRGVSPNDGRQLAHQVGCLLKRPIYGKFYGDVRVELESSDTFKAVDAFRDDPSYRNIMNAVQTASMSENDRNFVDYRLKELRRFLIKHPRQSLMDELTLHHIQSAVGSPTQDISPFVATSTCPGGANPSRTLMILNVPISEVAGPGEDKYDGFEVLVTGSIKPEWITAVAELHKGSHTANKLSTLVQALGGEENTIESSVFRNSEIHRKSRQNRPKDLREINKDLIEEILSAQNVDADALNVEFNRLGIDTYQAALWTTANYYLKKLHKIEIASLKDLDEIEAAELVAPESAHTRYQYDDVTPYRLESSDPGMVNSAKELNIKEIEILADMYACRLESYKKSL